MGGQRGQVARAVVVACEWYGNGGGMVSVLGSGGGCVLVPAGFGGWFELLLWQGVVLLGGL